MKSIDKLLDDVKKKHGLTSDYKLALFLGLGAGNLANYRHKRSLPSPGACAKIAAALDLDPDVLAVHFEAERAKDDETRAFWHRVGQRLQMGAVNLSVTFALAILFGAFALAPEQASASPVLQRDQVCALCLLS